MEFRFEQTIELPRSTVFAFHEDPAHLGLLHKGWATFRMIRHDERVCVGSRTWLEISVAKILPVVMGFEHHVYEPPRRFGEKLIHGPFSQFTHIHEFDEVPAGTVVRDLVEVRLPWYYGGELSMRILVAPMLRRSFARRATALLNLARVGEIA